MGCGECAECGQPARHHCAKCSKVGYCSKLCQRKNWKKHKLECFPLKLVNCDVLAEKHLVTTRDVKQWEVILKEDAFVTGPSFWNTADVNLQKLNHLETVCLGCNFRHKPPFRLCSTCGWPVCSTECEQNKNHAEFECALFKSAGVEYTQMKMDQISILAIRCILMKKSDPETWNEVQKLKSNAEKRGGDRRFQRMVEFLKEECKLADLEEMDIFQALGAELTNGFESQLKARRMVHMFKVGSWISHSCLQNTHRVINQQGELQVRACVDLPAGTRITTSFATNWLTTPERQAKVQADHFLTCHCARCLDPTELGTFYNGIRCHQFNDCLCPGYALPINPLEVHTDWQCTVCERKVDFQKVTQFNSNLYKTIKKVPSCMMSVQAFDNLDEYIGSLRDKVHPNHCIVRKLEFLFVWKLHTFLGKVMPEHMQGNVEVLTRLSTRIKEICEKQLKLWDVLWPGYNDFRGTSMYLLSSSKMCLLLLEAIPHPTPNMLRVRREKVKEAEEMRDIAFSILKVEPSEEMQILAQSIRNDPVFLSNLSNGMCSVVLE